MAEHVKNNGISTLPNYLTANTPDTLNNCTGFGVVYAYVGAGVGSEGNVFCIPNYTKGGAIQIFVSFHGELRKIRTYNWSSSTWTDWADF